MRNWLFLARDIAWTAVFSVVLALLSIVLVISNADLFSLAVILGISSVSLAILSNRT